MPRQLGWQSEEMHSKSVKATDELLARLIYFHGVHEPEATAVESAAEPKQTPMVAPVEPAKKPFWFEVADEQPISPKVSEIKRAACKHFKVSHVDMISRRRTAHLCYARQIGYFLSRSMTARSLPEIGRQFGNKDHTTVLHGIRKIERLVRDDWMTAYDVAAVERTIETAP